MIHIPKLSSGLNQHHFFSSSLSFPDSWADLLRTGVSSCRVIGTSVISHQRYNSCGCWTPNTHFVRGCAWEKKASPSKMTAFAHFAKRFSLIMMPLYSLCLTVQSGKTEMKLWIDLPVLGSQIYKENNSFGPSDCFALTEKAEGTGPFLLTFFFCFCSLAQNFELATELKVFFGVTLIQGEINPRTYNLNFQGEILSAESNTI